MCTPDPVMTALSCCPKRTQSVFMSLNEMPWDGQKRSGGCSLRESEQGNSRWAARAQLPSSRPCCVWFPTSASCPASEGSEVGMGMPGLGVGDGPSAFPP